MEIIKELQKLIEDIENIKHDYNDDDYYWHGVSECETKVIKLIECKIERLKGEI